jgi:hypothetical protein
VNYFSQSGCTAGTLAAFGEQVFTSPEYAGLGYGDGAGAHAVPRRAEP